MDRKPSNDELRLAALLDQFLSLSDDQDNAGRVIFRGPNGEYVGEAKLSVRDIEAATEALDSLNRYRQDLEEATRPAEPLPIDESEIDADKLGAEAEAFLKNGGQL